MKAKFAERILVKEIGSTIKIDAEGQIWRIACRHNTWQGMTIQPAPPHRAEDTLPSGYLRVAMMIDRKTYNALAHRLVWQYFYGNIPDDLQINHKNGIKNDNRPQNLELVTPSQQRIHAYKTGLQKPYRKPKPSIQGEKNPTAKLTTKQVREIRRMAKERIYSQPKIAKMFAISLSPVEKIVQRVNWKYLSDR